jgi:branched-chain amino acid transport system permease protein
MAETKSPIKKGAKKLTKVGLCAGLIVLLLLLPLFIKSSYYIHVFIITLIYIIATSSLRTIAISGQISLGHAGFMSIGAYTAGVISTQLDWTPWVTIPLGGLAAAAVAILVGYPFTRLRAMYFAIVSLLFGMGILAVNSVLKRFTGGAGGLIGIPPLFVGSKVPYYYFFLGLAVLSLIALYRFENCRIGTTLKAVAQSHLVASSIGINESGYRVLALAVGCFVVGIVGAGYAHYSLVLGHGTFGLLASINLLAYAMVGGIGSFAGPIVGTAILVIIPEVFRGLKQFTPYLFACILIIVVFVMPQGLAGLPEQIKTWARERRKGKRVTRVSGN